MSHRESFHDDAPNPYLPPRSDLGSTRSESVSSETRQRFDCPYCSGPQSFEKHFLLAPFGKCSNCRQRLKLRVTPLHRTLRAVGLVGMIIGMATLTRVNVIEIYAVCLAVALPVEIYAGRRWSRLDPRGNGGSVSKKASFEA